MTSNKFLTLDFSWSYPCVCLTGSQFWRSSRKILVAKASEMANLKKGKGKIKKAPKTGDILERLLRIVSDVQKMKTTFWIPAPCFIIWATYQDKSRQEFSGRRNCPLCRTSMSYVVIPVLREICNLIATPVPNSGEEPGVGSDTDTFPYGVGDEEDLDLRTMFWFHFMTELLLQTIRCMGFGSLWRGTFQRIFLSNFAAQK